MSITDWVWISVGQFSLAATFALGIFVGIALTRKDSTHGDGNEGESRFDDCGRHAAGGTQ
jgi:hypothetical protein